MKLSADSQALFDRVNKEADERAHQDFINTGGDIISAQKEIEGKIESNKNFSTMWKESTIGSLFQTDDEKLIKAKEYAQKTGFRESDILYDNDTYKKTSEIVKQIDLFTNVNSNGEKVIDWKQLYALYPELEYFVQNRDSVADAALYLKNLKNVREIQGVFEGFSTMYTQGNEEKEYYELSIEKAERLQSGKSFYAWTSDKEVRLQELEEKRKNYKVLPTNIFDSPGSYIAGATGEQVPRMIDMGVEYAKTRGALTIGAGIFGGAAGGAAGLFGSAGVGAAPGAAAGAKAAMAFVQPYAHYAGMASSAYDISKESAGRNYEKYSNMRDANGKLIFTPEQAYKMAWTQGAVEGGIEVASFGAAGKIILGKAPARVKGLIAERLMKSEVAAAFAGGTINEATKATGRKIVADGLKGYFKVVGLESAEEGVQEFASMAIENLVFSMKRDEGFDVDSHSFGEMVASSLDATIQAVPASLGLGILGGVVSSPLHAVSYKRNQSLLRASEEQRAAMKNAEGQAVFDTLKEKKVLVELQQKSPELARDIFQKQAEKFDQGSWLLDVPSLLKHEGGMEVLQKIADAQKISSEQLKEIISSGADFKVQSGVLYQDVLNTPLEEIVRKNITLSENAPTIEKIEEEQARVEELKKMVDADLQEESKTTKRALDTFFPEKNKEREVAASILERNTTNPLIAWQEARLEAGEDYFNSLEPYLEYMEQNPNGKWAESYFKENPMKEGETLSLEQKVGLAENMASGMIPIDMEVSQEQTEALQSARERVQEIENIKDRITQVNEASSSITSNLTPEGVQVFTKVVERLKEVIKESGAKDARKSIRMGAAIFARFADTYARVKREAGFEGYTALDYYNEFIGIESGRTESLVAFSQPVTNKQLNSTSKVNVVDISSNIEVDPNSTEKKQEIAKHLIGKKFSIQHSDGIGKVASLKDGRHLVGGSNHRLRKHPSRKKALTSIEKILANAVFVEKHDHWRDPDSGRKFVRLYSAAHDNGRLVVFRIVAEERGKSKNNHEVLQAHYYDLITEKEKEPLATPHSEEGGHKQEVPKKLSDSSVLNEDTNGRTISKDTALDITRGASHTITLAELLEGVNDIEGNPYIDQDGNLNTLYQKQKNDLVQSKEFKAWFGDSKVVDEHGKPLVVYYGTPYGGFEVFKENSYFTEKEEYANVYHSPSASSVRGRYDPATNQMTYPVYLKIEKPFDTRNPKEREIFEKEFYRKWGNGSPLMESGLPDWVEAEDLIEFIEEMGYDYDGLILDEGGVGGYGDEVQSRGLSFVPFEPNQIKSIDNSGAFDPNNPNIYYQEARGYISIFENGKRVINLLETADSSTFLHETAHEMLISLQELATMENAPEWIVKDFEAVKKYVGWQDGQTTFTREQQEQWATSFEAYLESGEAPTKGLRNVFRAFKKWLFDIYKDAVSQNIRATPEIEAVMARLIASQEDIDMHLEEQGQFEEKGGMENSAKQSRDTYSKWVEEMREEAKEKLLAVAMEDLKNLTPEDIQREVDKERETYRAELEQEQIWQDQALYEASGKSESILESLGYKDIADFEEQKVKTGGSLDEALNEHIQNFEARLKNPSMDLAFLRNKAEQIIAQDRYKELKDAFEFEALRKKVRKEPGNKTFKVLQSEARKVAGSVKEVAKIKMDELLIPQAANFKMWLRKEQSANRKMLDALTKGKLEEALQQKSLQLTYSAMARIAMDNQKFYTKAKKKLKDRYKRMNRTTNRQRMPLAERYHYNDLMFKLGFSNVRAFDPISEIPTIEKLFEGYNESMDLNGDVFPEWASERISKNQTIDADYLTMEEFQDLYNALNVIYTIGKDIDGLKTMDLSLDEVMEKMQGSFEENFPEKKRVRKNLVEADSYNIGWGDTTQNYMLNIIQPIRLIERLGKPFIDTLSFIADQGDLREIELTQKVNKASKELFRIYSDQERHEMYNKKQFDLPRGGKLTKENLVVMGLNWGNEINRDRVLSGFQLTFEEATELLKNLNARDWKFIQGVWDLNETLWPETARVEERMNGVVLNKVQALPFEIVDRKGNSHKLSGGYFHIAYNSKKSSRVAANEQMDLAKSIMPRNAIFGRGLGATKKRAQKYNNPPLLLDFSVITNHYSEAIHNISKRETTRDLNKVVSDPRFENIVSQAYGMEAYKKIQQWVKDVWGEEQVGANSSFVEKSVKRFRLSANMAIMGFRATTSLLNLANIAPMSNRLGTGKALKAVLSFYSNPQQSYRFVMENSAMLRERAHTIDYTVNEIDKNIPRNIPVVGKVASKFLEVSYAPITWTDLMLSMPLWMQVYRDTVDSQLQGKESLEITKEIHEKAVFEGNRAVRDVFGSGLSKDLAPVQKGGELSKALTPFYSFFNAQLNVVLDGWYEGKNTGNYSKMVKSIFFNFVLASVISAFLRGLADGDDDEEGKFLKEFLNEFTGTAFGGFFGVRDVVNALMTLAVDGRVYGNGAPTSLYYQSAERAATFFSTVRSIWNEKGNKDMIDFGRDLTKVFNSATGFPDTITDAFWTSLRWFDNDFEDELWDYLRSVIFDKKLKKR